MGKPHETPEPNPALARIEQLLGEIARHLGALRHEMQMQRDFNSLLSNLAVAHDEDARSLRRHQGQVYSQNGEDGLIAEIFRRLGGPQSRVFIEIGVGNGLQNNTRFLLEQGWRGLWIEGFAAGAQAAAATFRQYVETGQLQIAQRVATPENINEIVGAARLPDEIDFLSVDVDQHTHTLWEALRVKARVHCVEYNGSIPPSLDLWVPYDPEVNWDGTNFFGAALKTLERIGRVKGLNLVGCDFKGVNAFFVEASLCADRFLEPFTAETHYELPKYGRTHWDLWSVGGHWPSRVARRWLRREDS